jgi:ParB-like chromosome segregation protein Spo0J
LEGAEFDALVADIKAHGLQEPITLYQGMILDGRNRHRACLQIGIEPIFQTFAAAAHRITDRRLSEIMGETEGDALARTLVISKNIHRRHLTAEQRSAGAASRGAAGEIGPATCQGNWHDTSDDRQGTGAGGSNWKGLTS